MYRKKKKVLLFGTLTPPIHGGSIAFTFFKNSLNQDEIVCIDTTYYGNPFIGTFRLIFILPFVFCLFNFKTVYFICSRTKLSFFMRDMPLILFSVLFKKEIFVHLHGADFKTFIKNSGILKPLVFYCYNKISTAIVLLEEMKKEFEDFTKMKIEVIPNCYEPYFEKVLAVFPKPCRMIYLSNIKKSKGIMEFLDSSEILLKKYSNLEVWIVGAFSGDHLYSKNKIRQTFFKKYNQLKKDHKEKIIFKGAIYGREKTKLLVKASIFILPSYFPIEAVPISIIEAMKTGNAIVTTRHNYLGHLVTTKNGRLIDIKSSDAIVEAVEDLLRNKNELKSIQNYNILEASKYYNPKNYITSLKKTLHI